MLIELVSVIVPALNEAESLRELFSRVKQTLDDIEQPFEFIVVDDGSSDATFETAKSLREEDANICIVRHAHNCGKSMALRHGFEVAGGDVAVTIDADLQDQPEMIPRLLGKLAEGYDMVGGWRADRKDNPARKILSKSFNFAVRIVSSLNLHDINCGFKAYRRDAYKNLMLRRGQHRLTPVITARRGYSIGEVRIAHSPRKHGRSRFRLFRFRGLFDLVALLAAESTRMRPLRGALRLALLCGALAAVLLLGWFLTPALLQQDAAPVTMILSLCGFGAIVFTSIGTILLVAGIVIEIHSKRLDEDSESTDSIGEILEAKEEPSRSKSSPTIPEPLQD